VDCWNEDDDDDDDEKECAACSAGLFVEDPETWEDSLVIQIHRHFDEEEEPICCLNNFSLATVPHDEFEEELPWYDICALFSRIVYST